MPTRSNKPWNWAACALLGSLLACAEQPAANEDAAPVAKASATADRPAGSPLTTLTPAGADEAVFAGVVAEVLPAGGYTYLRVRTDEGDRWVATMGPGAAIGRSVRVESMGTRHDFHSKRLDRRFETIAFGIVREA